MIIKSPLIAWEYQKALTFEYANEFKKHPAARKKYKGKIIKLKDGNNQVEYIATTPDQIKTKSQLKDIWNKANGR